MTTDLVRVDGGTAIRDPRPEVAIPRPSCLPAPARRQSGRTAAEVMTRFPVTVDEHTSLFAVWGKLRAARAGHVVVTDGGRRPLGVLDERDIVLNWPARPLGAHHLPVHEVLRFRPSPQVGGEEDIAAVARTMLSARTDAVPVVARDGRLLGLVTAAHCVELVAGDFAGAPPRDRTVETASSRDEED